jgi:signal transduction histidine kinase
MRNRVERALTQGRTEPDLRDALHATIDEADQLIRTFNALLLIARAEAGAPDTEFAAFDAARVARDVVELYEPVAEEAGVRLRLESAPSTMVRAHRELVSQALANLVDNAIKYADEGNGTPEVAISVSEDKGVVTFRVADNGTGIAEPGAGLGLSLVSAVAQLHGGKLVLADNRPGLAAILSVPGAASGRAA